MRKIAVTVMSFFPSVYRRDSLKPLERIGEHYEAVLGAEGEKTHPNSIYATRGTINTLKEIAVDINRAPLVRMLSNILISTDGINIKHGELKR